MLRLNQYIFLDLHDVMVDRYGLKPSKFMDTYEMLAIFLFICGGCESNRRGQNRFKHSGETISRKFYEVLNSTAAMAKDYLRPTNPNFRTVHKRIRKDKRAYPHFKDGIGALDGTHIRVSLSPEEQVKFIGKTGILTQNVLAICDFDMRFTYVAAGQPGALHDTSVLYCTMQWKWIRKSSRILQKVKNNKHFAWSICNSNSYAIFSYAQASIVLWTRAILITQVTYLHTRVQDTKSSVYLSEASQSYLGSIWHIFSTNFRSCLDLFCTKRAKIKQLHLRMSSSPGYLGSIWHIFSTNFISCLDLFCTERAKIKQLHLRRSLKHALTMDER
jgi:hypothetical protein